MFAYDAKMAAVAAAATHSIDDVLEVMAGIGSLCADDDGLKWFNWLYSTVTQAVRERVRAAGGFVDAAWISALDVEFAGYYFRAIEAALAGGGAPGCWQALFNARNQPAETRLQCALAGMNAHINHDLPQAIVGLCATAGLAPAHGTTQYIDYTALNSTLDAIIDTARHELNVRLCGDALPDVTRLENLAAAWGIGAAREVAWKNAEVLWHIQGAPPIAAAFLDSVDAATAVTSRTLLVPV
jgi:hypothetical protein